MKNKLFIHEYAPGSGKTHSMIEFIKESDCRVIYAAPTLKLVYEISQKLDCFVVTNETPPRGQTVAEYLYQNSDEIYEKRVILTTHATLLRHAEYLKDRTLIIDELPLEILQFKSIWTSFEDAAMLNLLMNSKELVKQRLDEYQNGSSELSSDKAELLESFLNEQFTVKKQQGKDKYGFHYAYNTDPDKFNHFEQIHLMAATVKDTMPYTYFTNTCNFEAGTTDESEFKVRGNTMNNKVTIFPLVKFKNDRDYISKEVLETHFDKMVEVVQRNTTENTITITNREKEKALKEPLELIPSKAHGLNNWKTRTEAAVIYSANPNPYQIPFMEECSQAMGYDKDYLSNAYVMQNFLDVVYQTVTRTAIRVPEDSGDLKFFVPDMRSAKWLLSKFPNCEIDDSQAILIEENLGGGQSGNKGNTSIRGCPVVKALVEKYATKPKAARLVKKFKEQNGFEPCIDNPKHMLRLFKANAMSRVPKNFNFDVSKSA